MSQQDQLATVLSTNPSIKQALFTRYLTAILVDLVVLGLFDEYWSKIAIDSFLVALLAALLLQLLLQVSMMLERRASIYFSTKKGPAAGTMRFLSAWVILFISKLIILWAIDLFFGDSFLFYGRFHGVVPFLILVFSMLIAEFSIRAIYHILGNHQ
jgi:hypothetical protein